MKSRVSRKEEFTSWTAPPEALFLAQIPTSKCQRATPHHLPFQNSISLSLTGGIEVKSGESLPHPLLLYQYQSEILGPMVFKRHCPSGSLHTPQNEFVLNLATEAGMENIPKAATWSQSKASSHRLCQLRNSPSTTRFLRKYYDFLLS